MVLTDKAAGWDRVHLGLGGNHRASWEEELCVKGGGDGSSWGFQERSGRGGGWLGVMH